MNFLKSKFNKFSELKRGLTLVETLVAISILTIAVVGPLGIIGQALHSSYYTRDQVTAYYLSQEAIEYVRNLRDMQSINITNQYLSGTAEASLPLWTSGATAGLFGTGIILPSGNNRSLSYSLVRSSNAYSFISYDSAAFLKINSNGIYGDTSDPTAPNSKFKREIYFKNGRIGNGQDLIMVVNVYWPSGSSVAKFTLEEYFTNSVSRTGQ
jgi:prepilin-type N-terminal cleavage/methylation domain-containing protein